MIEGDSLGTSIGRDMSCGRLSGFRRFQVEVSSSTNSRSECSSPGSTSLFDRSCSPSTLFTFQTKVVSDVPLLNAIIF
jgi:hypothetical protein